MRVFFFFQFLLELNVVDLTQTFEINYLLSLETLRTVLSPIVKRMYFKYNCFEIKLRSDAKFGAKILKNSKSGTENCNFPSFGEREFLQIYEKFKDTTSYNIYQTKQIFI